MRPTSLRDINKIVCCCSVGLGQFVIDVELERQQAAEIIHIPGFRKAPDAGRAGWVFIDCPPLKNGATVRKPVAESYRLIAPGRSVARLDGSRC